MWFVSLQRLAGLCLRSPQTHRAGPARPGSTRRELCLEPLEDRCLLSASVVLDAALRRAGKDRQEYRPAPVASEPSAALICRKAGGRQQEYLSAALLSGTAGQAAPAELSAAALDRVFVGLPDEGLAAQPGGKPW